MPTTANAARAYHARGWNPLPLRPDTKRPKGTEWQRTKTDPAEYDTLFQSKNVGVALGKISNGLVDADLDDPIVAKIFPVLAKSFGIVTPAVFGRKSKPQSHHLYQLVNGETTGRTTFADGKAMLAEIRGDGHQTMFPPSIHPDGEPIVWANGEDATPLNVSYRDIRRVLGWTSAAALLIRNWDEWNDIHHVLIGALAGGFARSGVGQNLTESFVRLICHYSGDHEPDDRVRIVRDTYIKLADNDPSVTGFVTLAHHIGGIRKNLLIEWLQLRKTETETDAPTCSDDGNARRLVDAQGEIIRYCHDWEQWLIWDGSRWQRDKSEIIIGFAREIPDRIRDDARNVTNDDKRQDALESWSKASRNITRIQAMPKLARTDPRIQIEGEKLDADPWALNVGNGTVNLRTGGMSEYDKADYLTRKTPVLYNPRAECPTWIRYVDSLFAHDQTMIDFVQRSVGYTLTGRTTENIFFILFGPQGTGKTTFIETLRQLFGGYAQNADPTTFIQKQQQSRANPEVARLQGARFVSSSETEKNERLALSLVKRLSGETRITVSYLYKDPFEFDPEMKLWIDTNWKPRIPADDDATWARLALIPFEVVFRHQPTEIKGLKHLLFSELSGILKWAIDGCLAWQSDGLQRPQPVLDAVNAYKADSDALQLFIDEATIQHPDASCGSAELYSAYAEWAKQSNERPDNQRTFKLRMIDHGYDVKRTEQGVRWHGIRPAQQRATAQPFAQANPFQSSQSTNTQA